MAESSTTSTERGKRVTSAWRYWRRHDEPVAWWPWGLVPLIGLLLLYLWGAFITAPAIEDRVAETVADQLRQQGYADPDVRASGRSVGVEVAVVGDTADPAFDIAVARAHSVAQSTRCRTWIGRLLCPSGVALNARAIPPAGVVANAAPVAPVANITATERPHNFVMTVDARSLRIVGEVADEDARATLLSQANARFERVEDDLRITGEQATEQWPLALERALSVAANFERGSASWEATSLSARGLVQAERENTARGVFNDASNAPTLGTLSLEIAKSVQNCNAEFVAALSDNTINFETGSAQIDGSSQALIELLAQTANQCPGSLLIEGHTDDVGRDDTNLTLSQARASAVRVALNDLGVANNRLSAVGYGESQPIASNDSAAGRARNRRIVIQIAAPNQI